jgi:L-iditol 2-dehydrogenase
VFGLIPHSDANPLTGWFASHLLISGKGSTYFVVNDLDLKERMLLELACVCVHALKRANTTGLINFNSKVLVQGLGPVGLVMISVLRAAGVNHIVAIDGTPKRLEMAKKLGAKTVISFKEMTSLEDRVNLVKSVCNGVGVDFAFQCTGAPAAAKDIYEYIRRGGGMCEMGFFVNNGEYTVNPHFAMCNKEINIVGSWDYSADDYPTTMAFLRQAREMNIPIKELITHTFPLDKLNEAMEVNVSQQGIKICYVAE